MNRPIEIGLAECRPRKKQNTKKAAATWRGGAGVCVVGGAVGGVGEGGPRIGTAPIHPLGRSHTATFRNETQRCLVGGRLHVRWCLRLCRDCSRHGAPILYASILAERALNYEYVADLLQRNDLDQSVI